MEKKSVLTKLFDFSFSELVAVDVVRVLYMLGLAAAGIVTLGVVVAGFGHGLLGGVVGLVIVGPIVFLGLTLVARIGAELVLVLFRIDRNIQLFIDEAIGAQKPRRATRS